MNLFQKKLEAVHYNASLVVTDVIRGTSQERFNRELGLEPLSILFLSYLQEILSSHNDPYYQTRSKSVKNIYISLGKKNQCICEFFLSALHQGMVQTKCRHSFHRISKKSSKKLFWTLSDPKKFCLSNTWYTWF